MEQLQMHLHASQYLLLRLVQMLWGKLDVCVVLVWHACLPYCLQMRFPMKLSWLSLKVCSARDAWNCLYLSEFVFCWVLQYAVEQTQ